MFAVSFGAAFLLRFDFVVPPHEFPGLYHALALVVPWKMLVFFVSRLYRGWWIHSGLPDLFRILVANVIASAGWRSPAASC